MNEVQRQIDRQMGMSYCMSYDSVLQRLVVDPSESFYGLQAGEVVASFDQDPPIFACRFAEVEGYDHILALANEDGRVAIQDTSTAKSAGRLEAFQCHNNAVFDLAWMPKHMNFVTVSGDHTACLWDVAEGGPKQLAVFTGHTRSVKTAVFCPDTPSVFATGARDGNILVWDARAGGGSGARPENCLAACHAAGAPATPGSAGKRPRLAPPRALSITGLVFQAEHTLLSCGECDGNIKAWDLRKNYSAYRREPLPKHSIPYCGSSAKNGYTNLIVDSARVRLYASCRDDIIYCFNVSTYNAWPERRYVGHENGTFYIKTGLSPDGEYLVSGSSDKLAYVWSVRGARPLARLAGHRAEVTCAAWARGALVTCSDDAMHKLWRVGPELWPAGAEHRGRAEPVPACAVPGLPPWGAREQTPRSLKRPARPGTAPGGKRPRTDLPRSKRCLADLMAGVTREVGGAETAVKRLRLDSDPAEPTPALLPAGTKRPHTPEKAPTTWGYLPFPDAGRAFFSPTKQYSVSQCRQLSPRLRQISPNTLGAAGHRTPEPSPQKARVVTFTTPTRGLPDYVRTGEAPHLRPRSPPPPRREPHDWLTRMTRERKGLPIDRLPAATATPLSPKENLPTRRNSVTEKTPKSNKNGRTLLRYFTVNAKKEV